jgi:hypothetical protein
MGEIKAKQTIIAAWKAGFFTCAADDQGAFLNRLDFGFVTLTWFDFVGSETLNACASHGLPDNQGMLEVLRVTFPFFALVLCGYAAARLKWLPLEAISGLNGFVLFFA